jgi:hypothetical protein
VGTKAFIRGKEYSGKISILAIGHEHSKPINLRYNLLQQIDDLVGLNYFLCRCVSELVFVVSSVVLNFEQLQSWVSRN